MTESLTNHLSGHIAMRFPSFTSTPDDTKRDASVVKYSIRSRPKFSVKAAKSTPSRQRRAVIIVSL